MTKLGILYTSYSTPEYLADSLAPWVTARATHLGGMNYVISAVSLPFADYKDAAPRDEVSPRVLNGYLERGDIDYLITSPEYLSEADARTLALKPLLEAGCEMILLADGDEFYTSSNIESILSYASLNKWYSWFRFSLKNYVFDNHTYLAEPFTPPRLVRVNTNGYKLVGLHYDNDFTFETIIPGTNEVKHVSYLSLPSRTVPKNIAWIKHLTWLDNESSRLKVAYQEKRWNPPNGPGSGYKWENGHLAFNDEFYARMGWPMPQVEKE